MEDKRHSLGKEREKMEITKEMLLNDLLAKLKMKKEQLTYLGETLTIPNKLPRKKEWKFGSYYYYENYISENHDLIVREDGYYVYDGERWIPSDVREMTFHISQFNQCFLHEGEDEEEEDYEEDEEEDED